MTTITSRTDLITYLQDTRADLDSDQREAVADQIQHSDHPAWGADWEEWLDEELDGLVQATVEGLDALREQDGIAEAKATLRDEQAAAYDRGGGYVGGLS